MDKKDLFKDRRWTDIPQATVIGYREQSKEEREESKKKLRNHLKKIGVLKDDD